MVSISHDLGSCWHRSYRVRDLYVNLTPKQEALLNKLEDIIYEALKNDVKITDLEDTFNSTIKLYFKS